MKRLFLVIMMTVFVTGCVYSERRSPYGYSSGYSTYSTVTPAYPRYQEQRVYIQTPRYTAAPYFRGYEQRPEHEHHHGHGHHRDHERENNHHDDNDGDEHSNSRGHHRW